MASFNRIIIAGNLTRDPEKRDIGSTGQSLCRLSIASNRQYKNRQSGAVNQEVCYVDVDVWGAQSESCMNYLKKGRAVLVEGRLKFDSWKDTDGNPRSRHSVIAERVVFLGNRQDEDAGGAFADENTSTVQEAPRSAPRTPRAKKASSSASSDIDALFKDQPPFAEEDLPF